MVWQQVVARVVGAGITVLQYGCIAHCCLEFVGDFVLVSMKRQPVNICSGPSMQPTINPNDVILTERSSVRRRKIDVGDIVIARSPTNPRQNICKRVQGLEGDLVENSPAHCRPRVPRGHVWLEGDNLENSTDSRSYCAVPYALIRGRVFRKIWPPSDAGSLSQKKTTIIR